jgi:hypothetical protein
LVVRLRPTLYRMGRRAWGSGARARECGVVPWGAGPGGLG